MQRVKSPREVHEAVSRVKKEAAAYCSNYFPSLEKIQSWIAHEEMFCEQENGTIFYFRKERDFWRLYFCAVSPVALQRAVAVMPVLRRDPIITDIVGLGTRAGVLLEPFEAAGFRRCNSLFRMARMVSPAQASGAAMDSRVMLADKADATTILDLLCRSFDGIAERIPTLYEIEGAADARQIWIVRCDKALAGLLICENQGLTSTLRYWLIAPEFRAQRLGSGLIQRYFAEHASVRRFLLWVIANNASAIAKYKHYGFTYDGLVDHVLTNEAIRL